MKQFFILLIILFSTSLNATTYYIKGDATPAGDGLSWNTAWDALSDANSNLLAGDTCVCVDTLDAFTPVGYAGTSDDHIVFIDSFRYVNGYDVKYPPATWSATIYCDNSSACYGIEISHGDDYLEFIGFNIHVESNATEGAIEMWGQFQSGDLPVWFKQCRIYNTKTVGGSYDAVFRGINRVKANFSSCLFITHDQFLDTGNMHEDNSEVIFNNCSFFVATNPITHYVFEMIAEYVDRGFTVRNCIFYNNYIDTYTYANGMKIAGTYANSIIDFNYNCIYSPNTNRYTEIGGTWTDTIEEHRTAIQVYDPDGATGSIDTDPALQDTVGVNRTCTITKLSPCWETAVDIGYGDNIGWWQGYRGKIVSMIIQ